MESWDSEVERLYEMSRLAFSGRCGPMGGGNVNKG